MATMNKVIAQAEALAPSTFTEEEKARWLGDLDGMVSRVVLQQEESVVYRFPEDMDKELLIPPPYDGVYALYLQAMTAFHQQEYDQYNSAMAMFTTRFEEFKKLYLRENMPKSHGGHRNL